MNSTALDVPAVRTVTWHREEGIKPRTGTLYHKVQHLSRAEEESKPEQAAQSMHFDLF